MSERRRQRGGAAQLAFETLVIEGALLSPEWLAKVAQLDAGQQTERDYRIPKGLNLRDEIGRYWRIAQSFHEELVRGRDSGADGVSLSAHFVEPMLREVFGFTSLTETAPRATERHTFPVGHAAVGGMVPVVIAPAGFGLDTASQRFGDSTHRRSAFGLAQECLNATHEALWGVVCDGFTLRVVRDNASLTRPAWIEADLARIFAEERFADFAALWLLVHETRFGAAGQRPDECPLEVWRNKGLDEGTPARDRLRRSVEQAILTLGNGFVGHPENRALREALHDGSLRTDALFQQLLRLAYRLIFLLTAEERSVLHAPGAADDAKALYAEGYGLRRLRDRAARRSAHDRYGDLWESLQIVFQGVATGEPRLGLSALGGIFSTTQCPHLDAAKLTNSALLDAVFKLSWIEGDAGIARVNWRDMGPEELGSVYESLLELVAQVDLEARRFRFAVGAETRGNARKTSGSYYTPNALVKELLDSALEPVVRETVAAHPEDPASTLLELTVVDPACGSGHFLLAAARRLAAHIARLRARATPTASEYRHALREVVGRCIYGVDLNPMAIELCRVSLWMEAVEPGLPLSFLDAHLQCGNALLGATASLLEGGVPDDAWGVLEGDDKRVAAALKKRNKAESKQGVLDTLWVKGVDHDAAAVTEAVDALERSPDTKLSDVEGKAAQWERLRASEAYSHQRFVADLWCAAFVWPKLPGELSEAAPTNALWQQVRRRMGEVPATTAKTAQELAAQYRFFHWHLAFPAVFKRGGFDVVLGNPPWERVKLQEQEFFASRDESIANATNADARKRMIADLPRTNRALWDAWCDASREAEGQSHFVRQSRRYPLCGKGDVNTYALFAEHNRLILVSRGRAGFIVPTGIATDDTTKDYFGALVSGRELASFYSFENEDHLFREVHHAFKFALLSVDHSGRSREADLFFFARQTSALDDRGRHFKLSAGDFEVLNPNTRTCPTFRSRRDADLNLAIYRRAGVLWREGDSIENPWGLRFMAMFHMASDSGLFRTRRELEDAGWKQRGNVYQHGTRTALPLYEGRVIDQWDHRFASVTADDVRTKVRDATSSPLSQQEKMNPFASPMPRSWIEQEHVSTRLADETREWLLGWRDITASTNQRTVVASFIPRAAVGHTVSLMFPSVEPRLIACLYANLCSFALDYAARQKVGGAHLTYGYLKQLPVLPPRTYEGGTPWERGTPLRDWILPRVLELTYTAWDLEAFGADVGHHGPPFRWNTERRSWLRAELDAAFFHLYGLSRDDTAYVLETFPIVRRNDEKEHGGAYRTKDRVLEVYDALAEAARAGAAYATRLTPPPAHPRVTHEERKQPDVAPESLYAGAWSRPRVDDEAEMSALLVALLKVSGGATPVRRMRMLFALAWEPRLLMAFLRGDDRARWRRLIGDEAAELPDGIRSVRPPVNIAWKRMFGYAQASGILDEDLKADTWAPGPRRYAVLTTGWADARARWVWDRAKSLEFGEFLADCSRELKEWVDEAA